MIERLIESVVPVLLAKVATLPHEAKQGFMAWLYMLCEAFNDGDRARFERLLAKQSLSPDLIAAIMKALWNEDQVE